MATASIGDETYEFDPNKFMNVELIAVERETGMTSFDWQNKLNQGSMIAVTALIWVLRKRQGKIQQFDEIEFETDTLVVDFRTPEEVAAAEKAAAEAKESESSDSTPTPPDDSSPTPTTDTSSSSSSEDG